jgi:hypothetical protein
MKRKQALKRDKTLAGPVNAVAFPLIVSTTMVEARERLIKQLQNGGGCCELCGGQATAYYRWLDSRTVFSGLALYKETHHPAFPHVHRGGYIHLKNLFAVAVKTAKVSADYAYLEYFGMIEPQPRRTKAEIKNGALPHTGYWKLTEFGDAFFAARTDAPFGVFEYKGQVLQFVAQRTTVQTSLGTDFDYRTLVGMLPP